MRWSGFWVRNGCGWRLQSATRRTLGECAKRLSQIACALASNVSSLPYVDPQPEEFCLTVESRARDASELNFVVREFLESFNQLRRLSFASGTRGGSGEMEGEGEGERDTLAGPVGDDWARSR